MKIEIKNLTKIYGNNKAVNDLTLTLTDGIYGILGPNGSGKTTLINLLTDNVKRTSGEILINNKDIVSLGAKYREHTPKTEFAQAFMERPELIVLDEPTNALDEKGIKEFHEIAFKNEYMSF